MQSESIMKRVECMDEKNVKEIHKPERGAYAAIVTGASSGIGLAIAETLCELGYRVYGFGRDFERDEAKRLQQNYADFQPIVCDLLDMARMCDEVNAIRKKETIKILVNAAGVGYYGLHEELSVKQIQTLVRTNLEVPLLLTNRLLRTLKEQHGYVINVSSITAKKTNPHGCAYGAVKAGLTNFGESLFEEARKYGVKVTNLHPDMTDTNLYRDADFTCSDADGCALTSHEVADAVRFVLSQRDGVVVPDITIRPQYHRIARKERS